MKSHNFLSLLFIVASCLSCNHQKVSLPDYSKFMGCNGDIESITQKEYWAYYADGEWFKSSLYGTRIYRFDEAGNIINEKWINDQGDLQWSTTYEYDNGDLKRKFNSAKRDYQDYDQVYVETEEDGTRLYVVKYNTNINAPDATYRIKIDGNSIVETFYGPQRGHYVRTESIIDECGRIIEEKKYDDSTAVKPWSDIEYDYEEGRRIRATVLNDIVGNKEISYPKLDNHSNWLEMTEINDNSTQHFIYERKYSYRIKH